MKKILTIALVALLAASTAFAGISGSATVKLGYDTTSKVYGFANDTGIDANIELATDPVEKVAEGDIYAGIKASMKLAVAPRSGSYGYNIFVDGDDHGLGLWLSLDEAYVAGEDWKVSILGGKGAPDYASSAIDTVKDKKVKDDFGNIIKKVDRADTYKLSAWNGAGVALTYKGYTIAGGFKGDVDGYTYKDSYVVRDLNEEGTEYIYYPIDVEKQYSKYFAFNLFAETKAFEFEGGSAQVAVIVARDGHTDDYDEYDSLDKTNLGFSAKASYAKDEFSASVAGDLGLENLKEIKANFDVAANITYTPATLDVYYQHGKELLSAKVSAKIENVSAYAQMKDILKESGRKAGIGAEATFEALNLGGEASLTLASKEFSAGVSAKYEEEKYTLEGGVEFGITFGTKNTTVFYATAGVSSEALISGAKLSLTYGADSDGKDMNFLKDQKVSQNLGAVTAACTIEF